LVDAAQTIGHLPIDVEEFQCDFLAAPGHKGLLGPQGTGFLYVSENVANQCNPLRFGGTGTTGDEFEQPTKQPTKFESGSLNIPGIAGLHAGLKWLESPEAAESVQKPQLLTRRIAAQLSEMSRVKVFGQRQIMTPTVSFNITGVHCQTVGMILDSQFQIECRTGLHCAPEIHSSISSKNEGGTVRFSPGVFTTEAEVDQAITAVKTIANEMGATK